MPALGTWRYDARLLDQGVDVCRQRNIRPVPPANEEPLAVRQNTGDQTLLTVERRRAERSKHVVGDRQVAVHACNRYRAERFSRRIMRLTFCIREEFSLWVVWVAVHVVDVFLDRPTRVGAEGSDSHYHIHPPHGPDFHLHVLRLCAIGRRGLNFDHSHSRWNLEAEACNHHCAASICGIDWRAQKRDHQNKSK